MQVLGDSKTSEQVAGDGARCAAADPWRNVGPAHVVGEECEVADNSFGVEGQVDASGAGSVSGQGCVAKPHIELLVAASEVVDDVGVAETLDRHALVDRRTRSAALASAGATSASSSRSSRS